MIIMMFIFVILLLIMMMVKYILYFFCKILNEMKSNSVCYFICPKMFYKNQQLIKLQTKYNKFELYDYLKENNTMPPYFNYDKYKLIELNFQ